MKHGHSGKYAKKKSVSPKHRHSNLGILLLCILAAVTTTFGGITFSRYLAEIKLSAVAMGKSFYFTSNYLRPAEENAEHTIYGNSVDILLKNTDGLNVTTGEIFYTFTNSAGTVTTEATDVTANGETGKSLSGTNKHTLTAPTGTTVTVTAYAKSPYEKKLTAKFLFADIDESSYYEVSDEGYVVTLNIFTGTSHPEELTINSNGLIPDRVDGLTDVWGAGSATYTLTLKSNAHYILTFFDSTNQSGNNVKEQTVLEETTTSITLPN